MVSYLLKSADGWYSAFENSEMIGAMFTNLRMAFDAADIRFFMESLRGMGSKTMNCVHLCLISREESNFLELMEQTPRLVQLVLDLIKPYVFILIYFLSTSTIFPKS